MGYTGEKKRTYQRQWIKARRDVWIKEHGPCVDCGGWEELEIDHRDRSTKERFISRIWSYSAAKRMEELEKCVVRCTACHRKKTHKETTRSEAERHGRYTTYNKDKCRCAACVAAANEHKREYRTKGGAH
jgi:5-methylcytosine-specific restriction endonuclease McrA